VLYVEDRNWQFINATINQYSVRNSDRRDYHRILYPLMYDKICPECLQETTASYAEGGCNAIPAVRDSYFFLPVQAEIGPYFQCTSQCEVCETGKKSKTVWPSPFDCKAGTKKAWYDGSIFNFEEPSKDMPILEYVSGKSVTIPEDLRLFAASAEDRAAKNKLQVSLLAKIFGGSVVLLCVSVVCTALSRSRRASSGYDIADQVEAGQVLLQQE